MKQFIAKAGDGIEATDLHSVTNTVTGETQQLPFPFSGTFDPATLEAKVRINSNAVATINSKARNEPPHMPPPSDTFQTPPTNLGELERCTVKVLVNGKKVARAEDACRTCTESPQPQPAKVQVRQQVPVYIGTLIPGGG